MGKGLFCVYYVTEYARSSTKCLDNLLTGQAGSLRESDAQMKGKRFRILLP